MVPVSDLSVARETRTQEGAFDPSKFVDRSEKALKDLVAEKNKGHKPARVAEPDDTNVVDLM